MMRINFSLVYVCLCFHIATVLCQFGFFPQREDRRQQYGLAQNFFPSPRRITNSLSGILHFRPRNQDRNQQYIYNNPFNNIPGISNNRPYYDPQTPNYPYEFNQDPNNVKFPERGRDIPNDSVNFERPYNPYEIRPDEYPGFNGNNENNGKFPGNNGNNRPDDSNNQNGGLISGNTENNGAVFGNNGGIVPGNTENNNPAFGNNENSGLISGITDGPVFGNNDNGGLISGNVENNRPIFGNNENGGLISGHTGNNGPVFGNNENGGLISGNAENNGPVFGNTDIGGTENSGVSSGDNDSNGPVFSTIDTSGQDKTTEAPTPVIVVEADGVHVPVFADRNNKNDEIASDVTTLPPLTPVPAGELNDNFNFGSHGVFKETCQTIDGGVGSCISIKVCEPYVKLLVQAKTNPEALRVLRGSHCGFEGSNPKVCCPRPGIPEVPPPPPEPTTPAPDPIPSAKTVRGDFVSELPEPPFCGVSNASFSRVVGGVNAKLGDFLWMALLGYKSKRDATTRWLCGGSLISPRHILTAAHCIHNHETDLYVVRLGELDLARDDEGATPIDMLIKTKIKHEAYDAKAYTNDIGILVLDKEVQYTDLIRPICIPKEAELRARSFENYNPLIAGWGDTEFRGPSATHLQVLQLPVVSNEFCAQAYSQYKAQVIDKRVLCAGFKNGGKDACQGDSGGPLMQPIWNSVTYETFFYQIGVVSFGKKCAEAGFPGVYTRVTEFVPWIQKNVLGTA